MIQRISHINQLSSLLHKKGSKGVKKQDRNSLSPPPYPTLSQEARSFYLYSLRKEYSDIQNKVSAIFFKLLLYETTWCINCGGDYQLSTFKLSSSSFFKTSHLKRLLLVKTRFPSLLSVKVWPNGQDRVIKTFGITHGPLILFLLPLYFLAYR